MATLRDNDALKGYTDAQLMTELERRRQEANSKFAERMTQRQGFLKASAAALLQVATSHDPACRETDDRRGNPEHCARCFLLTIDRDGYMPEPDRLGDFLDLQLQVVTAYPPHSS